MTSTFVRTAVVMLTALPMWAAAQTFLEPDWVSRGQVVEQLRSVMGHQRESERIQRVKGLLRSTYMALPQDAQGTLDHRGARYALHRHFLAQHGWYLKGLSDEVDDVRDVSSTTILKSQMPALIMDLLTKQLGSDRVTLEDLAVVAATIQDLADADAVDLLEVSYRAHHLATEEPLRIEEAVLVMRTFLLFYLLPRAHVHIDNRTKLWDLANGGAQRIYSGWTDTVLWMEDLIASLWYQDRIALQPFAAMAWQRLGFRAVARWALAVSAGTGFFQNIECEGMKNNLLDTEEWERDDGRITLPNFYAPHKQELRWSPGFLRNIAALDEHSPRQPSVIVSNFLHAEANCLTTFGFQSMCCINSCEALMAELEQRTLRPAAAPALIAEVVSAMPSETVAAPRNLSAQLLSRLDDLAGRHGGSVPLHSRLFAQWMHYAFPNECSIPRSLMTSEPELLVSEWSSKTKLNSKVSQEEVNEATRAMHGNQSVSSEVSVVPWSDDEELLSEFLETDHPARGRSLSVLRLACGAAIFVASASTILLSAREGLGEWLQLGDGKYGGPPSLSTAGLAGGSSAHVV